VPLLTALLTGANCTYTVAALTAKRLFALKLGCQVVSIWLPKPHRDLVAPHARDSCCASNESGTSGIANGTRLVPYGAAAPR
jgi:hypothetical protein